MAATKPGVKPKPNTTATEIFRSVLDTERQNTTATLIVAVSYQGCHFEARTARFKARVKIDRSYSFQSVAEVDVYTEANGFCTLLTLVDVEIPAVREYHSATPPNQGKLRSSGGLQALALASCQLLISTAVKVVFGPDVVYDTSI